MDTMNPGAGVGREIASRERTELLQEYHREIDDVRAVSSPEGVPYLDKRTPQAGELYAEYQAIRRRSSS